MTRDPTLRAFSKGTRWLAIAAAFAAASVLLGFAVGLLWPWVQR